MYGGNIINVKIFHIIPNDEKDKQLKHFRIVLKGTYLAFNVKVAKI